MVKVTVEADCGNAPRKEFLKQSDVLRMKICAKFELCASY